MTKNEVITDDFGIYVDTAKRIEKEYLEEMYITPDNFEGVRSDSFFFSGLLIEINQKGVKVDIFNLKFLDKIFNDYYIKMCMKYKIVPLVENFLTLFDSEYFNVQMLFNVDNINDIRFELNNIYNISILSANLYTSNNHNVVISNYINNNKSSFDVDNISYKIIALVKKWKDKCKQYLINNLNNSDKASINKIYVSKAVYGVVEQTQKHVIEIQNNATTPQEIESKYINLITDNEDN